MTLKATKKFSGVFIMMEAYSAYWHNLFNFSGTASRKYYWWPMIINYVLGIVLVALIQSIAGQPIQDIHSFSFNTMSNIVLFLVWLATLSVKFRRLHDSDHSGLWILMEFVPLIGTIWFFILMVLPSKANRWS